MNTFTPRFDKPKPIITKIVITEEQQEDIKHILETNGYGKKRLPSAQSGYAFRLIRAKYFNNGLCHNCGKFPSYKLSYRLEGITLLEFYCDAHLPDEFKEKE